MFMYKTLVQHTTVFMTWGIYVEWYTLALLVSSNIDFLNLSTAGMSLVFLFSNYHKDIMIWLVNEGHCDPNVRDNDGETVLHFACR